MTAATASTSSRWARARAWRVATTGRIAQLRTDRHALQLGAELLGLAAWIGAAFLLGLIVGLVVLGAVLLVLGNVPTRAR